MGMPTKRFLQRIKDFPAEQKLIFWGSCGMFLSVFMPWYQDLDAFKTGVMFLGITGPLYLVGLLFLVMGAVSLLSLFYTSVRDRIERVISNIGDFYVMEGAFGAFLLLLALSVFSHPSFGVNITLKEYRFGMIVALVSVFALYLGGNMLRKRRARAHDFEHSVDDFIGTDREHADIENPNRDSAYVPDRELAPDDMDKTIEEVSTPPVRRSLFDEPSEPSQRSF